MISDTEYSGKYATAWGNSSIASGDYATAWGGWSDSGYIGGTASGTGATAWGTKTSASGNLATAWGEGTEASGTYNSTAWGYGSKAYTNGATAWGDHTEAGKSSDTDNSKYATAWGSYSKAYGKYSTAFGGDGTDSTMSVANAANSLAALGGVTESSATNSAAIGKGATASLADTVALGSGSVASRANYATTNYKAYLNEDDSKTSSVWRSTHNAIAVGDDSTVTRQITGVAAGSADTDAVNVAQLKAAATGGGTAYTAGDGIAIDDTTKAISVKANTGDSGDFKFDSGTLNLKKDGAVATGNTGVVTGGTVFTAIQTETRVASDGNYIQAAKSAAQNLTALDTQVKTNADAIAGKADKATTLTGYGITDAAMLNASNINVTTWASKLGTGTVTSSSANLITGKTVYTEVRPANDGTYVKTANTTAANLTALDNQVKANADALAGKADSTTVYSKSDMDTKLNAKADASNVYTKAEADTKLNAKANAADVYTKTETDSTFAKKSDVYTKSDVDTKLNTKADKDSVYTKTETDTKLNTKADKDSVYTKTETDTKLNTKADKDSVYTKTETDTKLNAKADASNVYSKSDVDTKLDTKADKTELATVKTAADTAKSTAETAKTTADAAKAAVDTIADTEKINTLVTDVDTLKANEGGEVAAPGEVKANKNVTGEKVYNYLNGEALALGANSNRIAMGGGSSATGTQSIAIGFGNTVSGANSGAFGDPNTITGTGSYAVGNNNTIGGNNTFVLGSNVTANVDNAVVLGNKSTAEADAVSVGSAGGERQIKHVADGRDDTDAVNKRQMDAAIDNAVGNNMVEMSHRISDMDNRINKVGAGAAALAALHPIDTDDKFTMGLGYGHYHSANAMAMGLFYRPTEKVMFSVGGAFGNGENMINAGISFALDKGKGFGTSKAAMARKIAAQGEEIQSLKAENAEIKEQNAKLAERLAAIEAKLGK